MNPRIQAGLEEGHMAKKSKKMMKKEDKKDDKKKPMPFGKKKK